MTKKVRDNFLNINFDTSGYFKLKNTIYKT